MKADLEVITMNQNKLDLIIIKLDNIIYDIDRIDPYSDTFPDQMAGICRQIAKLKAELVGINANIKALFDSIEED